MPDERSSWECRAAESGTRLSGVLFRGLPDHANAAIHAWHSWVVAEAFAPAIGERATVLDLGCGYGRLSRVLQDRCPEASVLGQDVAISYCHLFHDAGWPSARADALALPFANSSFDAAMAVTCLMYAGPGNMARALGELHRVVRPSGTVLLLDPALELQRIVARVRGRNVESPTGGQGFTKSGYLGAIGDAGFRIVAKGGNPWFTAALLIASMGRTTRRRPARLLEWCSRRDRCRSGYSRLALHRWVLATRDSGRS